MLLAVLPAVLICINVSRPPFDLLFSHHAIKGPADAVFHFFLHTQAPLDQIFQTQRL